MYPPCELNHLDGEERAGCFTLFVFCLVIVVWLFLTMPRVSLQFVIVVFPDHTHLHVFCVILITDYNINI